MLRRGFLGSLAAFLGLGAGSASAVSGATATPAIEPIAAKIKARPRFIECRDCRDTSSGFSLRVGTVFVNVDSVSCFSVTTDKQTGATVVEVELGKISLAFPVNENECFLDSMRQETL